MAAISSLDVINSQIDVGAIVDNLIYAEGAPVRKMQSRVSSLQSKASIPKYRPC
jgi:flagellar capping protein FliD